jgi:PAS domain S-box-containing protein
MSSNPLALLSPQRSIRGRFFLVTAGLCVLSVGAMVLIGLYLFNVAQSQRAQAQWEKTRADVAHELAEPAQNNLKIALLLARMQSVQDGLRTHEGTTLSPYLANVLALDAGDLGITDLDIRTDDGMSLVHIVRPGYTRDEGRAEMIADVVRTRTPRVGLERRGDVLQAAAAVPVIDGKGQHLGTLSVGSAITNATIDGMTPQKTDLGIELLGDDRFKPYVRSSGFLASLLSDQQKQAAFSGRNAQEQGKDDDRSLQFGAFPLEDYGGRALGIVEAHLDLSDIHAGDSRMVPLAVGLIGLLLFDAALLAIWGGYRLTDLFRRLTNLMSQFAAGNLTGTVPATDRGDELGQMARAIVALRDGLQRRERDERAFREIDKRHRLAAETTGIGTWFPDPVTGQLNWSDNFRLLIGVGKDVVPSIDALVEMIHRDDREAFRAVVKRRQETDEIIEHEYRVAWPDGSIHWVRSAGCRARDETGRVIGVQGTLVNIDERKRAEAERTILTDRLLRFEAEERVRLARELHDQIAQNLTGLSLGLKQLEQDSDDEKLRSDLKQLRMLLADTSARVHQTAGAFHPTSLDDLGLNMALESYVKEWSLVTGIIADFHSHRVIDGALDADLERAVFGLVKEVLDNIAQRAQANRVSVVIEASQAELRLVIDDDGEDFAAGTPAATEKGKLAMSSARERLAAHGGTLEIESSEGSGTARHVRIPLTKRARESA